MILLINICKEKLHYYEFVKPIEEILNKEKIKIIHYQSLKKKDLEKADKIIICGTSLKDNQFIRDKEFFQWIKDFKKPLLGICGGMQLIQLIHGGILNKNQEIGFYEEDFKISFLGLKGKKQVYHLHNNYVTLPKEFNLYAGSKKIPQAIKYKNTYGVLFHPEVRNKELIENFSRL